MDFLDYDKVVPVGEGQWVGFLGLGNNKQKATAQNTYEADIQARYPFSDNCEEQKKLIAAMLEESRQTLVARNSAKKGKGRNDLTGKLRAFDQYIPAAQDHLKNTSCSGVLNTGSGANAATGQQPNTGSNLQTADTGILSKPGNMKNIALIGFGVLILVGGGIFIYKKLKS